MAGKMEINPITIYRFHGPPLIGSYTVDHEHTEHKNY
jgi:hypothetical protein